MFIHKFRDVLILLIMMEGFFFMVNGQEVLGEILSGPKNQTVVPGATVHFNCHARGVSVYWLINESVPYPENSYVANGFMFEYHTILEPPFRGEIGEYNYTIVMEARLSNNYTHIVCKAEGQRHGQAGVAQAFVTIAGTPFAPTLYLTQVYTEGNAINHILNWSQPFTWSEFPITNYTVIIQLYEESITTMNSTTDRIYTHTSFGRSCYVITFSVAANNQVGQSEVAIIQSGHPIVADKIDDIETEVIFLSDVIPHLRISFLAPRICPEYQIGSYIIAIFHNGTNNPVKEFGRAVYHQENAENKTHIVKEVQTGLLPNQYYQVIVVSESIGVSVSNNITISTYIQDGVPLFQSTHFLEGTTSILLQTIGPTSKVATAGLHSNHIAAIAGSTSGVIVLIVVFVSAVMIILVWKSTKNKQTHSSDTDSDYHVDGQLRRNRVRPSSLKMQANNPIYEGAVYETIPGESLKSLLSPASTPSTPSADSATRYVFDQDMVPSLPPPRKGSVCQTPTLEPIEKKDLSFQGVEIPSGSVFDEEYMIMQNSPAVAKADTNGSNGQGSVLN